MKNSPRRQRSESWKLTSDDRFRRAAGTRREVRRLYIGLRICKRLGIDADTGGQNETSR